MVELKICGCVLQSHFTGLKSSQAQAMYPGQRSVGLVGLRFGLNNNNKSII